MAIIIMKNKTTGMFLLSSLLLMLGCTTIVVVDSCDMDLGPYEYPSDLVRPSMLWVEGFAMRLHAQNIQKYETPIQVWQTWRIDQLMWNCIAAYQPLAFDALTKERPMYVGHEDDFNSETRALCIMHGMNKLVPDLVPISAQLIHDFLESVGLCNDVMSTQDAVQAAEGGDQTPKIIGSYVAGMIIEDMQVDGWNYKGYETSDGPCTANCRPFTDTTGYAPKNSPWDNDGDDYSMSGGKKSGKKGTEEEYSSKFAWQPLIESDDLGFFHAQEHVTPHIGFTAKPVILSREQLEARELDDPEYDYDEEVELALGRVQTMATDPFQQDMVEFMDNKINIAGGMIMRLRGAYDLSLEAQVFYHYGYTSSELDVVLLSWKEKINHDLVRPTTLVQKLGDRMVLSFANGGEPHEAKDWVPFIRVMPHAEYPSGSGCICLAVSQFIDAFLYDQYGDESIATTWTFERTGDYTFDDMSELADICGTSRLWGGMHFTASVPDSYELCDGVGTMGYVDLMYPLLGGGDYHDLNNANGTERYCSDAPMANETVFCMDY